MDPGTIMEVIGDSMVLYAGAKLDADVINTGIGVRLQLKGVYKPNIGCAWILYYRQLYPAQRNATILQDVPHVFCVMGFIAASWTLGADATALLVFGLLECMCK